MRLVFLILMMPGLVLAQKKDEDVGLKRKAFYKLVNSLIDHSVDEIKVSEVDNTHQIWLDAREKEEFDVSRIDGAKHVGYDHFDIKLVEDIDKHAEVIVYCSIGYRSEKVAEKLEAAGFTNVKNLYGGIFEWSNAGKQVVDSTGAKTNKVHGYSRTWGIWLNDAETVY